MKLRNLCLLLFVCAASCFAEEATLAVVQKISGTVGFYTAEGKHLTDVKLGDHPHEAALSPDGRLLYVTDNGILWMTNPGEGGNTISIIDIEKRTRVGVIDLGNYRRPHGIDIEPESGRMVVTIENPDGVLLIDPASRKVLRKYDVQGQDPHMVLFGPKGEWAYVSNTASATVAAVELRTGKVKLIPTDARPQGGVLSRDGKLIYLTNSDGNSISIIDTGRKERVGIIKTGEGPGRIALTRDETQLVYNLQAGNAVGFADVKSRKQTTVIPLEGPPLSLRLSPDGKLAYSGVQSLDKVYVISVDERKILRSFNTPKEAGPDVVLEIGAR
jgi:YVTN family beta-propeller protein